MDTLFDTLESWDLIGQRGVRVNALRKIPFAKLIDLSDLLAEATAKQKLKGRYSLFDHSASVGLGGGRADCWSVLCRLKRIDELSRFTVLYSDHVFIHNFFADYSSVFGHPPVEDNDDFRSKVADDIAVLLHIRPLIEAGLIAPFTPPARTCPACLVRQAFGEKAAKRLRLAERKLATSYFKELRVSLQMDEYSVSAHCRGPEHLLEHGSMMLDYVDELPDVLLETPQLLRSLATGKEIQVSAEVRRRLQLHEQLAAAVVQSVAYQCTVSGIFGTSFLTHRSLHLEILKQISHSNRKGSAESLTTGHLHALVPFLADVSVTDLLRLRDGEQAALIEFRAALRRAIDELGKGSGFSTVDADRIYRDTIEPELARLDRKIKRAQRQLVRTPVSTAVATVGVLGLGFYSGLIPQDLALAAEALGLLRILQSTLGQMSHMADLKEEIREEKFYFLWQVREIGRRGSVRGHTSQ